MVHKLDSKGWISVIPCLSSGMAKNTKIMSMFVVYFRLFDHSESCDFFENKETNLITKHVLVSFSKIQQLSSNFSKECC